MKKYISYTLCLSLLIFPQNILAQHCYTHFTPYVPPTVLIQKEVIYQPFATYVGLPVSVNFAVQGGPLPERQQVAPTTCDDKIKALERKIEALTATGKQELPAVAVLKNNCASCHTGDSNKGNNFKIFEKDGSLTKLSDSAVKNIVQYVYTEQMPPKKPLSTNEQNLIAKHFD